MLLAAQRLRRGQKWQTYVCALPKHQFGILRLRWHDNRLTRISYSQKSSIVRISHPFLLNLQKNRHSRKTLSNGLAIGLLSHEEPSWGFTDQVREHLWLLPRPSWIQIILACCIVNTRDLRPRLCQLLASKLWLTRQELAASSPKTSIAAPLYGHYRAWRNRLQAIFWVYLICGDESPWVQVFNRELWRLTQKLLDDLHNQGALSKFKYPQVGYLVAESLMMATSDGYQVVAQSTSKRWEEVLFPSP